MKMFLRTSYGIAETSYSGDIETLFQRVVQGSEATPALCLIMSIFLMHYLCSKNLPSHMITPISGAVMSLAALMFVDDTDLYVLNSGLNRTENVVDKAQRLLDA